MSVLLLRRRRSPQPAVVTLALLLAAVVCSAAAPLGLVGGKRASLALPPPPPPTPRPAPPHKWVALSVAQRTRAEQLLSIFENSSLQPAYAYAENLRDGRGITFGRSGFCTGTGDGLVVVQEYVQLRPQNNTLARFLPVLELIERQGGGDSPLLANRTEAAFIQAVKAASRDPLFRQAQDRLSNRLYFQPSQQMARSLGLRLPLSKAQLYDAYVQHGWADVGSREYGVSAKRLAALTSKQLGGSPLQGVDERQWLQRFLERRKSMLRSEQGEWADGAQRVDLYAWLLQMGGTALDRPMQLSWQRCRPDKKPGPCLPQTRGRQQVQLGGIIYGDFSLL